MVDRTRKFLNSLRKHESDMIRQTMAAIVNNDIVGLEVKKLKGVEEYRVRKGRFRIRFKKGADRKNVITRVGRRNKGTYRDL